MPDDETLRAGLREALTRFGSHAVAAAARLAEERELDELARELASAFERFLESPVKRDPGCSAKAAIAEALARLAPHSGLEVFECGARTVQLEPVWGGHSDTAVELRGVCLMGLARGQHPDALDAAAEGLADPELGVRRAAARAVAQVGRPDGGALLRLKALAGDAEPLVTGECLGALISLAPESGVAFAQRFLEAEEAEVVQVALLALGESRASAAFEVLRRFCLEDPRRALRASAFVALASLRSDESFAWLFERVAQAPGPEAREALAALGTFRHDAGLRQRAEAAAGSRTDGVDLARALAEAFAS